jgi:hypothetical protein
LNLTIARGENRVNQLSSVDSAADDSDFEPLWMEISEIGPNPQQAETFELRG